MDKLFENRRIKKDQKTMLFENMVKLNPDLKLNKKGTLAKKRLNEYDNYNYPAGADADPNAPWHQNDDVDEYDNWNFDKHFDVILNSQHGGTYNLDWWYLMPDGDEFDIFLNQLKANPKDPELRKRVDILVNKFLQTDTKGFEWDYPERDGEPTDRGDRGGDDGYGAYGYEGPGR